MNNLPERPPFYLSLDDWAILRRLDQADADALLRRFEQEQEALEWHRQRRATAEAEADRLIGMLRKCDQDRSDLRHVVKDQLAHIRGMEAELLPLVVAEVPPPEQEVLLPDPEQGGLPGLEGEQ